MNSLTYNLKPKPTNSQDLLFHFQTAVSAFEALQRYSEVTTKFREPIPDAEAFLKQIIYEDSTVRVVHPVIGGRWDLEELSSSANSWSFGGDHSCETCGNIRLWGHQTYKEQLKFEPTFRCSGEKKGGNSGPIPCRDYYPYKSHLRSERDEQLPKLIQEAIAAERFKFPSKVAWKYQVTNNDQDSKAISPQSIIYELREAVKDFDSACQLFDVLDTSRKPIEDRELFLRILAQQPGFVLRSDELKLNWDISDLHQLLLRQERTNLLKLIDHVINESRTRAFA